MTIMPEIFSSFWFLVFASITITSVVATVAQAWQKVRRTEQEAVLKQEMLQRGLSVEEMERLLRTTSTGPRVAAKLPVAAGDDAAIEELAQCLGECQASATVIEKVLAAVHTADSSVKQTLCRAILALLRGSGQEANEEQILAVVRGFARPAGPPAKDAAAPLANTAIQPRPNPALQQTGPA
jgi:hypothetical protein